VGKPATVRRSGWRRRLTVGLRVVGWTALLGVVLSCALVALGMLVVREKDLRDKDAFAKLAPREHRLAIYDAFWNQISAHYYDQRSTGFDWKALRSEWRGKAAIAGDDSDLYMNVLWQLAQKFPSSHVAVSPPFSLAPVATSADAAKQDDYVSPKTSPVPLSQFDLGFELVPVQRASQRIELVGDVTRGSPAERAGIEPGWVAKDQSWNSTHYSGEFLRLDSMEQKISFEQHASFSAPGLTTEDADKYFAAHKVSVSFDVTGYSAPRLQPLIRHLEGGALYIRFDTFFEPVIMDKVLGAIANADRHGLILDLRGNTGGLESQERRLLSRLLPPRSILGYRICSWDTELSIFGRTEPLRASIFVRHYDGPVIVLIGPRSSSAAEIVADAMKMNHRGLLVGRITNGAVLVAKRFPLPDGGIMTIPTCDFLGPDKKGIEGVGVLPDIEVIPTLNDIRAGHDLVLERAERELRKGI
jgi:carboxyl-terminal processing protease